MVLGFWRAGEEEEGEESKVWFMKRMYKTENSYPNGIVLGLDGLKKKKKGQTRRPDALRRASAASASPAKHFAYSSKTEAFASPPSLKGALGAPRGEFF